MTDVTDSVNTGLSHSRLRVKWLFGMLVRQHGYVAGLIDEGPSCMFDNPASSFDSSPRYHRIASVLRGEIMSGRLLPGARLPSIMALAAEYSVAPVTVREALKILAAQNLVRSRTGSGTFVVDAPPKPAHRWLSLAWPQATERLRDHTGRVLEADDQSPVLLPSDGTPALSYRRMRRVHSDEAGEPYLVAEIFLDQRYYQRAPARFDREMVVVVLEELVGAEMVEMRVTVSIAAADVSTASLLGLHPGDALARSRRVLVNRKGEVVYVAHGLVRADRVAFELVMRHPGADSRQPTTPKRGGHLKIKASEERPQQSSQAAP